MYSTNLHNSMLVKILGIYFTGLLKLLVGSLYRLVFHWPYKLTYLKRHKALWRRILSEKMGVLQITFKNLALRESICYAP